MPRYLCVCVHIYIYISTHVHSYVLLYTRDAGLKHCHETKSMKTFSLTRRCNKEEQPKNIWCSPNVLIFCICIYTYTYKYTYFLRVYIYTYIHTYIYVYISTTYHACIPFEWVTTHVCMCIKNYIYALL